MNENEIWTSPSGATARIVERQSRVRKDRWHGTRIVRDVNSRFRGLLRPTEVIRRTNEQTKRVYNALVEHGYLQ